MTLFLLLLTNLVPLYLLIGVGYFAGRVLHVDRQMLANLAIYIFVPVVMFGFVADLDLKPAYLLLPVLFYILSVVVGLLFLKIGRIVYGDERANLLSLCTSMGNTGYFGLPVAMALFDHNQLGLYMFMLLGSTTYEATIGYYIAVRGRFNVRDSLIKLAKFPIIYATLLALIVNLAHIHLPGLFYVYWVHFKGAYVITGMMIIGTALAGMEKFRIAPKFLLLAFTGKFFVWPLVTFMFIWADKTAFHFFGPDIYPMMVLISIVPPAANVAAFAAQLDLKPEKAAATILIGTVFALFYIPLVMGLIGMR